MKTRQMCSINFMSNTTKQQKTEENDEKKNRNWKYILLFQDDFLGVYFRSISMFTECHCVGHHSLASAENAMASKTKEQSKLKSIKNEFFGNYSNELDLLLAANVRWTIPFKYATKIHSNGYDENKFDASSSSIKMNVEHSMAINKQILPTENETEKKKIAKTFQS